ncbi:MAG: hypothetical protein AAB875_02700 [Patescibacteria group bacterium]
MNDEDEGVSAAEPPGIGLLAILLVVGLAFVFGAAIQVGDAVGRVVRRGL